MSVPLRSLSSPEESTNSLKYMMLKFVSFAKSKHFVISKIPAKFHQKEILKIASFNLVPTDNYHRF